MDCTFFIAKKSWLCNVKIQAVYVLKSTLDPRFDSDCYRVAGVTFVLHPWTANAHTLYLAKLFSIVVLVVSLEV